MVFLLLYFSGFRSILYLSKHCYLMVSCHFHASPDRLFPLVQHLHCSYPGKPTRIAIFMCSLEIVTGHYSWPQNWPFDANLALLVSRNTAFLCKGTTHKTPQSAEPFAFLLS